MDAIAVGYILLGGAFDRIMYGAIGNVTNDAAASFLKITAKGKFDHSFKAALAGNVVAAICHLSDSFIFIGDRNDSTGSTFSRIKLAVIHPDGTADANYILKNTLTIQVDAIVKETDSSVLVAGQMGPDQFQNGYPVYTKGLMRIVRR